ncbi:type II toxin-antitoxin system VapC family toxin [Sulfurovum sp. bin170]|uniref:type II toxin-antitoxin system VapC family toxin n=1 Tax=Sulfurovum sp. bin170 TaxID=2695268 RepID=UPI0013E0B97D|nr:type II toxin-antitoxin system VapC family toxin [Sulfurovum sp. bin170]NEW59718.1 type II toxin-antitoxin system VapC family toxin [Sulfurovum sp. bin170]
MEDSRILIDTSVIIDYLRKQNKKSTKFWKLMSEYECTISTVTLYELYSGAKKDTQKEDVDILESMLEIIPFDALQAKKASEIFQTLKKKNKLIEFRDIFIASCAISKKIPLATLNKKHFERIKDIQLLEIIY